MILALGARGRGFESPLGPLFFSSRNENVLVVEEINDLQMTVNIIFNYFWCKSMGYTKSFFLKHKKIPQPGVELGANPWGTRSLFFFLNHKKIPQPGVELGANPWGTRSLFFSESQKNSPTGS